MPIAAQVSNYRRGLGINLDKCYEFNSSTSKVVFTTPDSIKLVSNIPAFTIGAWVYLYSQTTALASRILDNSGINLLFSGDNIQFQVKHVTTNASVNSGPFIIKYGMWNRIVGVWSDTYTVPKLYFNGHNIIYSSTAKSGSRVNPDANTYIGNRVGDDRALKGLMDDLIIWNRALSDDEIVADFQSARYPTDSRILYYDFNETSGNAIDQVAGVEATPTNVTQGVESYATGVRTTVDNRFVIPNTAQKSLALAGSAGNGATVPITPDVTGFSFGMWVKGINTSTFPQILSYIYNSPNAGIEVFYSGNNIRIKLWGSLNADFTVPVISGSLNHLVITYIPNSLILYINSVSKGSDTSCNMTTPTVSQQLTLGRLSRNGGQPLLGNLKNFTFQNTTTPWTQAQIDDLYWKNKIPSGALQWSMNDVATDQNGENALTLTDTSYSTDLPPHMKSRISV